MNKLKIPYYYAFYHLNMVAKISSTVIARKKTKNINDTELYNLHVKKIVSSPNKNIISSYRKWSESNVKESTPFHLVSLWSFPLVFDLLAQTGLPVVKVVNQGISVEINGLLPIDEQYILEARIKNIVNTENKKKLVVSVSTSSISLKDIVVLNLEMSFPQRIAINNSMIDKTSQESSQSEVNHPPSLVSKFSFSKRDGLNYSLLTGDFNPIHWLMFYAQKSPFKTTIMQGFGIFSRISSILEKHYNLKNISIKFLKPVHLPSVNLVFVVSDLSTDMQTAQYHLTSDKEGVITQHVIGQFTYI